MARDSMPLPAARGRAVSADAARNRGGVAAVPNAAPTSYSSPGSTVADYVAADPALEQLRSRKIKRTGMNVHINAAVHTSFQAFIDEWGLPKGDATSLAIQEFLERRGVVIPGVARVLAPPPPSPEAPDTADTENHGGAATASG